MYNFALVRKQTSAEWTLKFFVGSSVLEAELKTWRACFGDLELSIAVIRFEISEEEEEEGERDENGENLGGINSFNMAWRM